MTQNGIQPSFIAFSPFVYLDMSLIHFFCLRYLFGKLIDGILDPSVLFLTSPSSPFQASTPYSLESESLRMDCIMSGGASPTLAINAVTNKVLGHESSVLSVPQFTSPLQKQNKKRFISADLRVQCVPALPSYLSGESVVPDLLVCELLRREKN